VSNTTGEALIQTTGTGPETVLDLGAFPTGVYVVQVTAAGQRFTYKAVKVD
jgi:hypothetical protein